MLLLQRHGVLHEPLLGAPQRMQQRMERLVLERLYNRYSHHLLRLVDDRDRQVHLPREHQPLLNLAAPALAVGAGAICAALLGLPVGAASLFALFIFSCILVGLAQQTLP
jgi:hypothetical protein